MALLPTALRNLFNKSSRRISANETRTVKEVSAIERDSIRSLGLLGDSLPNPDEVLKWEAGGKSYDLYREMLKKDARMADLLRTRVNAIEAIDWSVSPYVDTANKGSKATPEAEKQADLIKRMFDLDGGTKLRRLVSISYRDSLAQGFSVDEIIFGYDRGSGKFIVDQFKPRKVERFTFNDDWELQLKGGFLDPFTVKTLDQWRFVIFRNGGAAENPYGDALCQELYWLFYFKKEIIKFWAIYLERFGTPILDIAYEGDLKGDADLQAEIEEMADNYINASGVRHPKEVELSLLEAKRSGEGTYDAFIRWADGQMAKSIVGQTLTTSEGDRTGSLALSQTHGAVAQNVLERDCNIFGGGINQQVIKPTIDLNWSEVPGYPKIDFDCKPPEDLKEKAETYQIVQSLGMAIPKKFAREAFAIPEATDGEEILEKPEPPPMLPGSSNGSDPPGINGNEPDNTPATTRRTAPVTMKAPLENCLVFSIGGRNPEVADDKVRIRHRYRKLSGPGMRFLHAPGETDPFAVSFLPSVEPQDAIDFMRAEFQDFAGKLPPPGAPRVGITSTFHIHDPFRKRILEIFDRIRPDLGNLLETDAALLAATEQLIRRHLPFDLSPDLAGVNEASITFAVESMATQLSLNISPDRFKAYIDRYLETHAFQLSGSTSEVVEGITSQVTKSLTSRSRAAVKAFGAGKLTLSEATLEITRQFGDMAEWKARQIAISEVNNAASWASIQVIRDTGGDWLAWFMVDPISCQTCLEQAARNPYKLHEAEILGLPHPNCNDFWSFTFKGEAI